MPPEDSVITCLNRQDFNSNKASTPMPFAQQLKYSSMRNRKSATALACQFVYGFICGFDPPSGPLALDGKASRRISATTGDIKSEIINHAAAPLSRS